MYALLTFIVLIFSTIHAEVTFIESGLSYDDVLLVPQYSSIASRRDVDTKTRLTKNLTINIPFVSSNMDTVTESDMAIAMAQLGGIGIIHRFNSIEDQVYHVKKVKRHRNAIIRNPLQIHPDAKVAQAVDLMNQHTIHGLLVVDEYGVLVGILTHRDIRFSSLHTQKVHECMTLRESLIVGEPNISMEQARAIMATHSIEKLPLVYQDGTVAGLITAKDIANKIDYPYASVDSNDQLLVGAAIGVREEELARAQALVEAGVDVLVLDIAHGHSLLALDMLKKIKFHLPNTEIIAGNVATVEGTRALIEAGADAVKVGIGPGSICTTRIVAGSGYPQLSAVINCASEATRYDVPVIADGGITCSGHVVKAIAAGACTVMLGSMLAGTDESPGMPIIRDGKKYKVIRGMASFGANLGRSKNSKNNNVTDFVPEGVEALKPYKGPVAETIHQLLGGLWSGMSYCGASTIKDLCGNAVFVKITPAGVRESYPHDVIQIS